MSLVGYCLPLISYSGVVDTKYKYRLLCLQLFTRSAARLLFSNMRLQRWCFDVELIYLAQRLSIPIKEVSVNWTEIPGAYRLPPILADRARVLHCARHLLRGSGELHLKIVHVCAMILLCQIDIFSLNYIFCCCRVQGQVHEHAAHGLGAALHFDRVFHSKKLGCAHSLRQIFQKTVIV